jgi:hypothetical protein
MDIAEIKGGGVKEDGQKREFFFCAEVGRGTFTHNF